MTTTTTAGSGWTCIGVGGEFRWRSWNGQSSMEGLASSLDDGREKASLASEILNRSKGDA